MAVTVAELGQFIRETPEGAGVRRLTVADRLCLEVRRPGAGPAKSSWVLRYTHAGKKQSLGLGPYSLQSTGAVVRVTLANAVKAAAEKLAEIDKGIQPVKARRATEQKAIEDSNAAAAFESKTVRKAVERWHKDTGPDLTSEDYRAQRMRRLEELLEHIGGIPVGSLSVNDVAETLDKVGARDRADTFRKASADLQRAMKYVAALGWVNAINAMSAVGVARSNLTKPKQVGRRFFKVAKLSEFSKALQKVDTTLPRPVTAHLLRLLTLTAARTREIRELKWSEVEGIDTDSPMLHVPAARMKRREDWSVPLSSQAAVLLRDIRLWQSEAGAGLKGVEDGFVFVRLEGNYKGRLCSENAVNDLLKVMGWHGELVGHGLRKVFSTVVHNSWPYHGSNRTEAIEFSLAHVHKDKVRGIYDSNDYMTQRRELMQWWSDYLDLMAKDQAGNVVQLRGAA